MHGQNHIKSGYVFYCMKATKYFLDTLPPYSIKPARNVE